MKKIIIVSMFVMVLVGLSAFDFRKTNFGMTKDEVKQREGTPILKEDATHLFYKTSLDGIDVFTIYVFNTSGKMYCGSYVTINAYEEFLKNSRDYKYFSEMLSRKYGDGKIIDSTPEIYRTNIEHAFYQGKLSIATEFYKGDTTIRLNTSFNGSNGYTITIAYVDIDMRDAERELTKKSQESNF